MQTDLDTFTKEMMHYAHVLLFSCHDGHVSARNHRVSDLAEKCLLVIWRNCEFAH